MKARIIPFVIVFSLLALASVTHAQNMEWASLNAEARLLYQSGQYDQAVVLVKKALDIAQNKWGTDHPNVAQTLNNLGLIYQDQGDYGKAESFFKRSLAIWEKTLGVDHVDVAATLNNYLLFVWASQHNKLMLILVKPGEEIVSVLAHRNVGHAA